ncbi:MAG: hypothetical protein IJC50_09700 [Clostridia bacterium]|nr:hypothetical protein [Clostridia bacterium]
MSKLRRSSLFAKKGKRIPLWARLTLYVFLFLLLAVIAAAATLGIKHIMIESEANSHEPDSREGEFYYNSLSWRDQQLYDLIRNSALEALERTEVIPYSYDMDTFENVVRCVKGDNPELFYVKFNELVINHGRYKTYVTMSYRESGKALDDMRAEFDAAVQEGIDSAYGLTADFACELAVHDWLVGRCSYASAETDDIYNTAYGALVLGRAYCDGYAYAMKAVFDEIGMTSAVVYGSVNDAEHVWNLVCVDGKYYHLDAMWDDADISYDAELRFHGYFNLDDNTILLDHSYYYDDILPEADHVMDYYRTLGIYASTLDGIEEIFYNELIKASATEHGYIELFCEESIDNEKLATHYRNAVKRANETLGAERFMTAFVVHRASERTNAATVQIFYN